MNSDLKGGSVSRIPLLKTKAGPRDGERWNQRLKEELMSLIQYIELNKTDDTHWFNIEPTDGTGTKWAGRCWHFVKNQKYELEVFVNLSVSYPSAPPEILLPQLDGKTEKMFQGGMICIESHFQPLWVRNVPSFGIAHAMALGLSTWLSCELPLMVEAGTLK